jgi:hypothetical protein
MLIKIAKVIGGSVLITSKGKDVIWVINNKDKVQEIIKIYDVFPPLSSKKLCQLEFLKKCIATNKKNSVDYYLNNRNFKYINQLDIISSKHFNPDSDSLTYPNYYKGWLSGFIEAEGCFSIRQSNNHSFSIGQKNDLYIINGIKQFFKLPNKVRNTHGNFYSLEIYKKENLKKIINHFNDYPLLGEKADSLKEFSKKIYT